MARLRVSASTAVTAALSPEEGDGILVDLLEEVIELGGGVEVVVVVGEQPRRRKAVFPWDQVLDRPAQTPGDRWGRPSDPCRCG